MSVERFPEIGGVVSKGARALRPVVSGKRILRLIHGRVDVSQASKPIVRNLRIRDGFFDTTHCLRVATLRVVQARESKLGGVARLRSNGAKVFLLGLRESIVRMQQLRGYQVKIGIVRIELRGLLERGKSVSIA
jgi:hypothetical protein